MTTDPRTLIAETIHAHGMCEGDDPAGCGNNCHRGAGLILAGLAAAGYRLIIPARTILGVQIADEPVVAVASGLEDAAPGIAQRWGGRTVQAVVGPWEPAPASPA